MWETAAWAADAWDADSWLGCAIEVAAAVVTEHLWRGARLSVRHR